MILFAIRDLETGEYFCDGKWGEEPEWFRVTELPDLKIERPFTSVEQHDFSPSEWVH